jgi:hypothetical protein
MEVGECGLQFSAEDYWSAFLGNGEASLDEAKKGGMPEGRPLLLI